MGKLSHAQIDEYFNKHLPYRTRIMLAHKKIWDSGWHQRQSPGPFTLDERNVIRQACFEASVVNGRLLLNMLGVHKNGQGRLVDNVFRADDVSVEDLGGKLLHPSTTPLPPADSDLFVRFLCMADKAAAHLTIPRDHTTALIERHDAVDRIVDYLKMHLYDVAGRTM